MNKELLTTVLGLFGIAIALGAAVFVATKVNPLRRRIELIEDLANVYNPIILELKDHRSNVRKNMKDAPKETANEIDKHDLRDGEAGVQPARESEDTEGNEVDG